MMLPYAVLKVRGPVYAFGYGLTDELSTHAAGMTYARPIVIGTLLAVQSTHSPFWPRHLVFVSCML